MKFSTLSSLALVLAPLSSLAAPIDSRAFLDQVEKRAFSKTINAPVDKVLPILQDFPTLARLNPLVVDVKADETSRGRFKITDKIPILGIFNPSVEYSCSTLPTADGIDVVTNAPLGVTIKDKWKVAAGPTSDTSVVTEDLEVTANALVMLTVTGNLDKSHNDLLNAMAKRVET